MRDEYGRQLILLNEEMINMGMMCEEAIERTMKALFGGECDSAQSVLDIEVEIDRKEKDIENLCMKLLLRQQPVAGDLRKISAALKMISDMERIGDQAEDIWELLEYMQDEELPQEENLRRMAEAAAAMVRKSVDSFVDNDIDLALKVIEADDEVDRRFSMVKDDLIIMISENPERAVFIWIC